MKRWIFYVALLAFFSSILTSHDLDVSSDSKVDNYPLHAIPVPKKDAYDIFNEFLNIITLIVMGFSIVGLSITLATFILFPSSQMNRTRIVFWLCVTIIACQLAYALSLQIDHDFQWCEANSVIMHLSVISNICWLFLRDNSEIDVKYYHLFGWCIPMIICMATAFSMDYGKSTYLCYIYTDTAIFMGLLLPGIIIFTIEFVLLLFCFLEIFRLLSSDDAQKLRNDNINDYYILIYICILVFLSWASNTLMLTFSELKNRTVFSIFSLFYMILLSSQGYFILIKYCANSAVIGKWKNLLVRKNPNHSRNRRSQNEYKLSTIG